MAPGMAKVANRGHHNRGYDLIVITLPRGSAKHSTDPLRCPTPRDLRARNPLSQSAVRTPQDANAPSVRPGRSLSTCWRAGFARAS